jgi:hypothetical protein
MSEIAHHLLIPFASVSSEAAAMYVQDLKLPNLRQLLDVLSLVDSDIGTEESFSPPHERALARAQGLLVTDGSIPWAALKAEQSAAVWGLENAQTQPWSFVTPCHSMVGNGSMTMEDPARLQISEIESRQLLADMTPYFAQDGLTLHYLEPALWLCSGEPLRGVRTASLDRVIGQDLAPWQPAQGESSKLRRLQNEMQMLLYTHTVNDARSRAGVATINSIWLHGTGEFSALETKVSANISTPRELANAALKEDWQAWVKAWEQLDATVCADLLKRAQAGEHVTLTLCGECSSLTYELRNKTLFQRINGRFSDIFRGIFNLRSQYVLPKQLK